MSEELRLYDIRSDALPRDYEDVFHTVQVFRCVVCKSLTNRVGVYPGPYHQRYNEVVCHHEKETWHKILKQKRALLAQPHPVIYRFLLAREIRRMQAKFTKDDIVGNPDLTTEKWFPKSYGDLGESSIVQDLQGIKRR